MPKFRCTNQKCPKHIDLDYFPKVKFKWNAKQHKLLADESICPVCGSYREVVLEQGIIQMPWFKAENDRNYNNKNVKQYDWDKSSINNETIKIPGAKK